MHISLTARRSYPLNIVPSAGGLAWAKEVHAYDSHDSHDQSAKTPSLPSDASPQTPR